MRGVRQQPSSDRRWPAELRIHGPWAAAFDRSDRDSGQRDLEWRLEAPARILPYLEDQNRYALCRFDINKEDPINSAAISVNLPIMLCPSEMTTDVSVHDYGLSGVINYGWSMGDWFVWGGFGGQQNRSMFGPNRSLKLKSITDGLSHTLMVAEVKTYQTCYICDGVGLSQIKDPTNIPAPTASPTTIAPEYFSGACRLMPLGHTEWSDGNVHASGFTTAWPPNTQIFSTAAGGKDMDLVGINEEDGGPTFAAITSRSYHTGGVMVLLADTSARFVADGIDGMLWRALGTVAGGEVIPGDF